MSQQPNSEHYRMAVYVISVAAELSGMHPQTLRNYERVGLLRPARTQGGSRRYSEADIALLHRIAQLVESGMNLEGIRHVLTLETEVGQLRSEVQALRWWNRAAAMGYEIAIQRLRFRDASST